MSRREPQIALRKMLAYAREAVEIVRGKTRIDLDRDRLLNLGLTRLVSDRRDGDEPAQRPAWLLADLLDGFLWVDLDPDHGVAHSQ